MLTNMGETDAQVLMTESTPVATNPLAVINSKEEEGDAGGVGNIMITVTDDLLLITVQTHFPRPRLPHTRLTRLHPSL